MQKGQVLIWVIVGTLIIAVAGGAFYLGRSITPKPSPNPPPILTPSSTPDANPAPDGAGETANWKTYSNSKLKFSFRYPEDYKFEKEDNERATFSGTFQPGNQVIPSEFVVYFQPTLDLNTLKSCEDTQFRDNVTTTCIDGEVTTKKVNGIQMNVFHTMTGSKNSQGGTSYVYQLINNPKIEFIHIVLGGGVETRVDQILSTFKFL